MLRRRQSKGTGRGTVRGQGGGSSLGKTVRKDCRDGDGGRGPGPCGRPEGQVPEISPADP